MTFTSAASSGFTRSITSRLKLTFAVMLACGHALCLPHRVLDAQTPPLPPQGVATRAHASAASQGRANATATNAA